MEFTALESQCVVSEEDCARNLKIALARGLPLCKEGSGRKDRLAVVAAGPSVPDFLDEIRQSDVIWAVNGAYHYLLSEGIVPHGFVGVDPLPGLAAYVKDGHPDTDFHISGLCDDSVFEALKTNKVHLWFPKQDAVPDLQGLPLIQGGTTAVTRAPFLAKYMGFTDVTLYGVDSSFERGRYCYRDGTYADDSQARVVPVVVNGEGPFFTEECLLKQVSQLGVMHHYQTWGVNLKIRCRGLMDAYMRAPMEYDAFAA